MRSNNRHIGEHEAPHHHHADMARISTALATFHEQITQLDELLSHSPDDLEIAELKEAVEAEMEQFKKQALDLRKRKLLNEVDSVYEDNSMVSFIIHRC